jgi:hypothetical protein
MDNALFVGGGETGVLRRHGPQLKRSDRPTLQIHEYSGIAGNCGCGPAGRACSSYNGMSLRNCRAERTGGSADKNVLRIAATANEIPIASRPARWNVTNFKSS